MLRLASGLVGNKQCHSFSLRLLWYGPIALIACWVIDWELQPRYLCDNLQSQNSWVSAELTQTRCCFTPTAWPLTHGPVAALITALHDIVRDACDQHPIISCNISIHGVWVGHSYTWAILSQMKQGVLTCSRWTWMVTNKPVPINPKYSQNTHRNLHFNPCGPIKCNGWPDLILPNRGETVIFT